MDKGARLYPVLPIARPTFRVDDCNNDDFFVGGVVDNLVGKAFHGHASSISVRIERPDIRLSSNQRRRLRHSIVEVGAQTKPLFLVPDYGGGKLFSGEG